ncbi:MAG: WecB/TagA/CpsF family glycosyltransferase [Capsulimonadaceae bacterium]|nr:WecB/TagA/CpsF family glycosyltransferase [Capsulimonadaceae bacterium]
MKSNIGGIYFDNVTMEEAVESIRDMARGGTGPHLVCTANLDHLASLRKDSEFRDIYTTADLILADGMPIVWVSKFGPVPLKERVAGSDLLFSLAAESERSGLKLFFLGGKPGAASKTAEIFARKYPGIKIVGADCPDPCVLNTPEEDARICDLVTSSGTDVLLVGFGAPKQEKWISAHRDSLKVPVSIGVGAAFDMAAGMVRRAPRWMQRSGLEWAFRLIQEPRRLYGRYLGNDLPYLVHLLRESIRERKRVDPSRAASKPNTLL